MGALIQVHTIWLKPFFHMLPEVSHDQIKYIFTSILNVQYWSPSC